MEKPKFEFFDSLETIMGNLALIQAGMKKIMEDPPSDFAVAVGVEKLVDETVEVYDRLSGTLMEHHDVAAEAIGKSMNSLQLKVA